MYCNELLIYYSGWQKFVFAFVHPWRVSVFTVQPKNSNSLYSMINYNAAVLSGENMSTIEPNCVKEARRERVARR